jgi:hypothetical protein
MADVFITNTGVMNGVTAVTLLAAPAASIQRVAPQNSVGIYNDDTIVHTVIFRKNIGGVFTILHKVTGLAAGGLAMLPKRVVLAATNESLEGLLGEVMGTVQPKFDVAALEAS